MILALRGEHLWSYCSNGSDPMNYANFATPMPIPADPKAIKDLEREGILDWLAKDTQAKVLIDRKISSVVASLLDETQSACQQWELLAQFYSHTNILSQYELCIQVCLEKLKDVDDATQYISVFEDACRRFIQMGITYTTEESVFDLIHGLPDM